MKQPDRTPSAATKRSVFDIRVTGAARITERELEWLCDIAEVAEHVLKVGKLGVQSKRRLKAAVRG